MEFKQESDRGQSSTMIMVATGLSRLQRSLDCAMVDRNFNGCG